VVIVTADGIVLGLKTPNGTGDGLTKGFIDNTMTCYQVYIDINGLKGANLDARDIFSYYVDVRDGQVYPRGGRFIERNPNRRWVNSCKNGAVPTERLTCTAAIVENDWHIRYNY
ncbi:hypothetical protein IJD34_04275, partial [bacterium]|nr:hypothetical protein [bacterium]